MDRGNRIHLALLLAVSLAHVPACSSPEEEPPAELPDGGTVTPPDPLCNVEIVLPADGDDCCPDGANANDDSDCAPVCGNGEVEEGEACDDGNQEPGDGCDAACAVELEPTAFRITDLAVRDPHLFALGLVDVTASVNQAIGDSIRFDRYQSDGTPGADGLLDFSLLLVFRPFDPGLETSEFEVVVADCAAAATGVECVDSPVGDTVSSSVSNLDGDCLAVLPGTAGSYFPQIVAPTGRCFVSPPTSTSLMLGEVSLTLTEARIAASYVTDDDTRIVNGLMRGFLSVEAASSTLIPADVPVVGGRPLAELLREPDRDSGPGDQPGWWFYLNFTGEQATYDQ